MNRISSKRALALILCLISIFSLSACKSEENPSNDLWANAIYTSDEEVGEGKNTVYITVEAGEKKIKLTIHSDETNLGKALTNLETPIISGEQGDYGLYIKFVNGIKADYDSDKAYWGFFKNGEYMNSGVDSTEFKDKEGYEFVYTKG